MAYWQSLLGERGQRCVGVRSVDRDCAVGVGGCANHQDPDLPLYKVGISCESSSVGGSKCFEIYYRSFWTSSVCL